MPFLLLPGKKTRLPPAFRRGEHGFLMMTAGVLILVIAAILASFAFVQKRDAAYHGNYTSGQTLARLAMIAHSYAQTTVYQDATSVDNLDLKTVGPGFNQPDGMDFKTIGNTAFSVEFIGSDFAPIAGAATTKAASAYIHLKIRAARNTALPAFGNGRPATDNVALAAGANSIGMARIGLVNINPGDSCDGDPEDAAHQPFVRWGPEATACLNAAELTATLKFNDVQTGDIIVPAWETAIAHDEAMTQHKVLFRFPQPERPDLNTMATNIAMAGFNVGTPTKPAKNIQTTTLASQTPSGVDSTIQNLALRKGGTAVQFKQGMTVGTAATHANLAILNTAGGGAMAVGNSAGTINFTIGANMAIADNLTKSGTQPFTAAVANPATVNKINPHDVLSTQPPVNLVVKGIGAGTTSVNVNNLCDPTDINTGNCGATASNITSLTMNNPTKSLTVTGTLDTGGDKIIIANGATPTNDIFAGTMKTIGSSTITNSGGWSVGSLTQQGNSNTHALILGNTTLPTQVVLQAGNTGDSQSGCTGTCPGGIHNGGGGGGPF